jgi:2-polyprenyl-6-methoxyphenol hydroxylase-like FAD-dependent oxidoreductase
MENLDRLGVAEKVLGLRHTKVRRGEIRTPAGTIELSFEELKTKFPYITLVRQDQFLELLAAEAGRFSTFRLLMGTAARDFIESEGTVHGVETQASEGRGEVRASLTAAADGRFSRLRERAGFEPVKQSTTIDVLWFRLPHGLERVEELFGGSIGSGAMLVRFDRGDYWQLGFIVPKDGYRAVRQAGIEAFRARVVALMPELAPVVGALEDWKQVSPLSIESSRLSRWHRPGLLFIGDAAHVMSPIGGVGINYAIQDAICASNRLAEPLLGGEVAERELAAVQKARWWPTVAIQKVQALVQNQVIAMAFDSARLANLPWFLRNAWVRRRLAGMIAFGLWPPEVRLVRDLSAASEENRLPGK